MPVIGFRNGTSPRAAAPFVAAFHQHRQQAVGDVSPHIREARRRAALASAVEGGGQKIGDDLFGERRGIDEHRVLPAGFGDERHNRPGPPGEIEVVPARGLGRAGSGDPSDARIGGQRRGPRPARMLTESWLCGWLTPLSFQRYTRASAFDRTRVRW
jgi:hypothetical protein